MPCTVSCPYETREEEPADSTVNERNFFKSDKPWIYTMLSTIKIPKFSVEAPSAMTQLIEVFCMHAAAQWLSQYCKCRPFEIILYLILIPPLKFI